MNIEWLKHGAGWRTLCVNDVAFHFFPKQNFREWGFHEDWYDGPIYSFGLGRLFLACWLWDSFWNCLRKEK